MVLTEILVEGLVEDGRRVFESLGESGPGELAAISILRVLPFEGEQWLALFTQGTLKKASFRSSTVQACVSDTVNSGECRD